MFQQHERNGQLNRKLIVRRTFKKEAMVFLMQFSKSGGKVLEGSKKRREKEREIFKKGIYAKEIYQEKEYAS